jgi:hypothetical protein
MNCRIHRNALVFADGLARLQSPGSEQIASDLVRVSTIWLTSPAQPPAISGLSGRRPPSPIFHSIFTPLRTGSGRDWSKLLNLIDLDSSP